MVIVLAALMTVISPPIEITLPSPATAVAMAKDGGFAVGFESGEVVVYRSDTGTSAKFREIRSIRSLSISPDGQRIATGFLDDGSNVTSAIWTRSGKLIRYFDEAKTAAIKPRAFNRMFQLHWTASLAWSPDGNLLAVQHCGHLDTGVRIWDMKGHLASELGRPSGGWKSLPQKERFAMAAGVKGLEFSPDGMMIATSMDDGYIRAWNLNGRLKWQTQVSKDDVADEINFSEDSKTIFVLYQQGVQTNRVD